MKRPAYGIGRCLNNGMQLTALHAAADAETVASRAQTVGYGSSWR